MRRARPRTLRVRIAADRSSLTVRRKTFTRPAFPRREAGDRGSFCCHRRRSGTRGFLGRADLGAQRVLDPPRRTRTVAGRKGHVRRADLFLGPPRPSPGLGEGLSRRALRGPGEHGVPDRGRVPRDFLRFDETRARPGRELHGGARQVRRMAREECPGLRRDARDRDSGGRPLEGGRPRPRRDGRSEQPRRCRCGRDRGRGDVDSHESSGPEGGPGTARSVGRREGDDRAARGNDPRTVRTRGEGGRRVRVRRPELPGSPRRGLPLHEPVDDLRRQHEGGESRGLRPVSSSEQRADGSRAVPASTSLHEERAPLRRVSAHVDGNRRAAVHRGRKRTTATRGRRPGAGGLGGRPETEDAPRPVAGSPIDVSGPPSGMRPMRIIVCIKQVPKAQELQVDPVTQTLKRVGVPSEINPPDANALEIALTLKDRHAAEVVVLSMGPTSFDESLERAVAMGADRSVLLTDRILGGSDTVPTAYALSETIQKIGGYDLILTGEETTDASTGHVGPGIAGHLDLPQITYVSEVRIVDNTVRARRTAEDGTEWWQTNMPSLCTVNFGCNKPRSPTLTGKIRVKRGGVIVHWSCADVGIDPKKAGLLNSPTIVAKVDTIRLPPRAGRIFSGDAKESVRALLDALIRDRVVAP